MRLAWLVVIALLPGATAAPDDVLRVYLARHGQTEWNAKGRVQGKSDVPLNEKGREQARQLAARLAGVPLDKIYTSALQRSRQTAEPLKGRASIEAVADLNEQSLGAFEGLTKEKKDRKRRKELDRRQRNPDDTLDGGESTNQHFARVEAAVRRIRAAHPRGDILIVGHGGTNLKVLRALLGVSGEDASRIRQDNDELYMVELRPSQRAALWKFIPTDRLKEL